MEGKLNPDGLLVIGTGRTVALDDRENRILPNLAYFVGYSRL